MTLSFTPCGDRSEFSIISLKCNEPRIKQAQSYGTFLLLYFYSLINVLLDSSRASSSFVPENKATSFSIHPPPTSSDKNTHHPTTSS